MMQVLPDSIAILTEEKAWEKAFCGATFVGRGFNRDVWFPHQDGFSR